MTCWMLSNPWRGADVLAEEEAETSVAASERVQAAARSARTSSTAGNAERSGRGGIRSVMGTRNDIKPTSVRGACQRHPGSGRQGLLRAHVVDQPGSLDHGARVQPVGLATTLVEEMDHVASGDREGIRDHPAVASP